MDLLQLMAMDQEYLLVTVTMLKEPTTTTEVMFYNNLYKQNCRSRQLFIYTYNQHKYRQQVGHVDSEHTIS